jgi:hypothetical protein
MRPGAGKGRQMSQSCPLWRGDIGAYIVGALDGPARDRVTRHLAACTGCKADFEELFPVRGWLAMAFGSTTAMPEPAYTGERGRPLRPRLRAGAIPASGLDDYLDARSGRDEASQSLVQQGESRASRWRRRGWLAAAGAAVAAAATVAVLANSGGSAASYRAVDSATGVSGRVQLQDTPAGTQIDLTASGLPGDEECILVAVNHGRTEVAGSWHVTYGGWARMVGTTGFAASRLTALRIESLTGVVLLSIWL